MIGARQIGRLSIAEAIAASAIRCSTVGLVAVNAAARARARRELARLAQLVDGSTFHGVHDLLGDWCVCLTPRSDLQAFWPAEAELKVKRRKS